MPSLCLFALFVFFLPLFLCQRPIFDYPITPQKATYYIDETSKTEKPDGSRDRPFNSLDEAAFRLYLGTFDIILLGESITITSPVNFPSGSVCIIRPQTIPESGHYPLKFGIGASIGISLTNVTFQDIQFIELDPKRDSLTNAITVSDGLLFLNNLIKNKRVLVSDIQYQDTLYHFISASISRGVETGIALLLFDSQFKNLRNVQMYTTSPQVMVQNTSFENIEMNIGAFLILEASANWENALRMSNTSLINIKFNYTEDQETVGFVMLIGSNVNVSLEGFSAKNVSIPYGTPLFGIRNLPDYSQDYFRRVYLWDVTLEDIVEVGETRRGRSGLMFDISGPEELKVRNLTARNLQFKNGSLLGYSPYDEGSRSQISLQEIKISNSSNANFLIFSSDSGQIENVELVNVNSKGSPVFFFLGGGTVSLQNISGRNISGSVISLEQVFNQNLNNITLYNVSMSQGPQNLILLTRYSNISKLGLTKKADQSTIITDLLIDGSEAFGGDDQEQKAYLMRIEAEIGTVLIRDSILRNIKTGGVCSSKINSLKVDNLTVKNAKSLNTLVDVNSGLVVVNHSVISETSGQLLFDFKGSSVRFDGTRISDIDCSEVKEACIVNGESVVLEWEDTELADVVLQGDLIILDEKSVEKGEVNTVNITKVE